MKRHRLLFAAAAAGLAMVAVAGMQITTSSTAYCAPKDQPKRASPAKQPVEEELQGSVMPVFVGRCVSCHQPGGEGQERPRPHQLMPAS